MTGQPHVDPILQRLTAPGQPFAMAEQDGRKHFTALPPDLNLLIEAARRHGDAIFIVEGDRRYSYADVFARRDALVPLLGIAPGDRVVISMRNRAEWVIACLAVWRAGGVPALANSRGSPAEHAAAVAEVSPALVIADDERADLLRAAGHAGRLLLAGEFPPPAAQALPPPVPCRADDPAVILFTSGTTGRSKGAVLSHRNLITGIMAMQLSGLMILHDKAAQLGITPEQIIAAMPQAAVLVVFPLFHISGLGAAFLSPMFSGSKLVIMRRWDPEDALRLIESEKVTQFTAVPTMLWDVLNRARVADADLSSLRSVSSGGQALPINLLEAIRQACPHAVMGTGYGMTETSGSLSMAIGEDFIRKRASAGRVLPLVEMRIMGEDGQPLPRGQAGEIVVRGDMVMQGYHGRPEETAAVLSPDGWLKTGDIGLIDEEDYVFIVDRKKDMVISGGENIYCAEVERVINEMPEVSECAAFGIPDERLGELLVAMVVADGLDAGTVIARVADALARYKAPGQVIFSPEPLPRNAVGKIDKVQLRTRWPALVAANGTP